MLPPMSWLRERLRIPALALREVFRNPNLRRCQLAWAGSITGQYAFSIALSVYAYRHGGPTVVGLVIVARMIPAAIVAPFAAIVADRSRRERVMLACDLIRTVALAGAGCIVFAGGPAVAVYALGAVVTTVATVFHPAEAALLPALARSPEELTATNVSSSSIESVGSFAGPAIGGLVLAATSIGVAFLVAAATFVWSALLVARIRSERLPLPDVPAAHHEPSSRGREAFAGFRAVAAGPELRVIVGLYTAQTLVAGAAAVLVVVMALRLLDLGSAGVGYLNSATGLGGLVGAAVALALVGRRRIAGDFGIGILLWGAPFVVIGLHPTPAIGLAMLGVLGLGNTLVDVSALTLLQRSVPDAVLARVVGVVEGLSVGAMGVGSVAAPLLIDGFGIRAALIATGLFLPVLALLLWPRLAAIDRRATVPTVRLELLRSIAIFAPLPSATIEHLAHALREVRVPAGVDVVRAGDAGHNFFVIGSGRAEVVLESESRTLGAGDYFGEIALLRDVPRTATVRALTDLVLYALARDEFIGAVTGHAPSRDAADTVIGARLGSLRSGIAPV